MYWMFPNLCQIFLIIWTACLLIMVTLTPWPQCAVDYEQDDTARHSTTTKFWQGDISKDKMSNWTKKQELIKNIILCRTHCNSWSYLFNLFLTIFIPLHAIWQHLDSNSRALKLNNPSNSLKNRSVWFSISHKADAKVCTQTNTDFRSFGQRLYSSWDVFVPASVLYLQLHIFKVPCSKALPQWAHSFIYSWPSIRFFQMVWTLCANDRFCDLSQCQSV